MNNTKECKAVIGSRPTDAGEQQPEPMEIDIIQESGKLDDSRPNRKRRRQPLEGKAKTFKPG